MTTSTPSFFTKSSLIQAFNRAAATYDQAAVLAQETGSRLLECLDYVRIQPRTILDLGAGTGYISQLLAKRYFDAQIIGLDFACDMLLQNHTTQLHTVCADAENMPFANHTFDLVVSNLMMPWCLDLPTIFSETARILKPSGLFLFSTLGPLTLSELHSSWMQVDPTMKHVHPGYDLHDVGDVLMQTGFSDPVLDTEAIILTYKNVSGLLQDLKATGSHNLLQDRRKYLCGKNRWRQFLTAYETWRDAEQKIPATFEVIYGHSWRANAQKTNHHPNEIAIPIEHIGRNITA